jgi:Spy/CpxP family protein refolding chaperone
MIWVFLAQPPICFPQAQTSAAVSPHHQPPTTKAQADLKRLTQQLKLSSAQQAKVATILAEQQRDLLHIRYDSSRSPGERFYMMRTVHLNSDQKIRAILDPEQAAKFDQLRPHHSSPSTNPDGEIH